VEAVGSRRGGLWGQQASEQARCAQAGRPGYMKQAGNAPHSTQVPYPLPVPARTALISGAAESTHRLVCMPLPLPGSTA